MDHTTKAKIRQKIINARKQGKTYVEINRALKKKIPKSTLSYWCRDVIMSQKSKQRLTQLRHKHLKKARKVALKVIQAKQKEYLLSLEDNNRHLAEKMENSDIAKIMLVLLYICEGAKNKNCVTFGNSDPDVVRLFIVLLRRCYKLDERKFRCTLQCRADQDIPVLENFWSNITGIPLTQFYKARVDPRTKGRPSKKFDYKGVCRINYLSAGIFHDLIQAGKILLMGP